MFAAVAGSGAAARVGEAGSGAGARTRTRRRRSWSSTRTIATRADLARFYAEKRGIPKEQHHRAEMLEAGGDHARRIRPDDRGAAAAGVHGELLVEAARADESARAGRVEQDPLRRADARHAAEDRRRRRTMPATSRLGRPRSGRRTRRRWIPNSRCSACTRAHLRRAEQSLLPQLHAHPRMPAARSCMLVCRLDGPTPEIVRRMITDCDRRRAARGSPALPTSTRADITEPGYAEGRRLALRRWRMTAAAAALPVVLDNGAGAFPRELSDDASGALLRLVHRACQRGPFVRPDFRFARGAVAVHIHSFSAPRCAIRCGTGSGRCSPAGAAATLGNVYEPYLALTPHLDVFHDRLRAGLHLRRERLHVAARRFRG